MKIVHLCLGNFFIDGSSYQENMLTKYHSKMGYEVTVIASLFTYGKNGMGTYLSGPSVYVNNDGVKVIRLDYKRPFKFGNFFKKYIGLKEALNSEKPDIIFCHNLQFGDTDIIAKYLTSNPYVVLYADNHADFVNSARNWPSLFIKHKILWKHYIKKLEPYLTKVYGVTPIRCRFLREVYNIKSSLIEFLPMGVDDEAIPQDRENIRSLIRAELHLKEGDILIMTGGKIEMRKNTHFLYEALMSINNTHLHLAVCGTFTPEMKFLEEKMKDNQNIHLLGWCDAERVMNVMAASDFVCFPGTHSTLWEQSVGLGIPAIFKHWNEIDHVGVNGNCIFVKGEDVTELSVAIDKLATEEIYSQYKQKAVDASKSFLYSDIARKSIGLN